MGDESTSSFRSPTYKSSLVSLVCVGSNMKAAFLLALFVAAALADSRSDFVDFTLKFNKQYASQEEFEYRYAVYLKNLELVAEMNNDGYDDNVFGVTKFMDLTPAEFKQQY